MPTKYKTISGTSITIPLLALAMTAMFKRSQNGPTRKDVHEYAEYLWLSEKQGVIMDYWDQAYEALVPEIQRVIASNMPPPSHMVCGEHKELPINIECDDTVWYESTTRQTKQLQLQQKRRLLANAALENNANLKVKWDNGTIKTWKNYDLNNESELDRFFTDVQKEIKNSIEHDKDSLALLTNALGFNKDLQKDDTEIAKLTKQITRVRRKY